MSPVVSLPSLWIVDACSALNLRASGQIEAILGAPFDGQTRQYTIADLVLREAAYLRRGGQGDDADERDAIEWDALIAARCLRRESEPTVAELEAFVQLAALLDDGEAMTLALAVSRGYGIVTDDRKAQKLLCTVAFVDTPTLLHNWSLQSSCMDTTLGLALRRIAEQARFVPPRSHPLKSWWDNASKK